MRLRPEFQRRRARANAGYTLVELMMALALFTVSVLGIISMQKITVVSNAHAKNLAIAQRIAQSWATQLTLDATTWQDNLTGASWLGNVTAGWVRPDYVAAQNFGAAFDALGNPVTDLGTDLANAHFCSHIRLTWLYPANVPVSGNGLMRAEIRVFWLRHGEAHIEPDSNLCADDVDPVAIGDESGRYHFIYQTTGIRQRSSI